MMNFCHPNGALIYSLYTIHYTLYIIHYTLYITHYLVHRDLPLDDGSGLIAHLPDGTQHLFGLSERTVVAYTADPAWRIEVNIYRLVGETHLDSVACLLSFHLIGARVAAGEGLYPVSGDLTAATHHLLAHVDGWYRHLVVVLLVSLVSALALQFLFIGFCLACPLRSFLSLSTLSPGLSFLGSLLAC